MSERPPVLLVHGSFSRGAHCGALAAALKAAGFECVAPSLPGHDPSDPGLLSRLSLEDYLAALDRVRSGLPAAPIVIGHSMGGLLAQHLAASGPCAALICLASAPPGMLPPQFRALPHLAPLLPNILAGRAFHPSAGTFRDLALHDLPEAEQDELVRSLGAESGRAFRSMILGTSRVPAPDVRCPVLCLSGSEDRIVSQRVARRVAAHYGADHLALRGRGHWLLARAGLGAVSQLMLGWLRERQLLSLSAPV